jgi:hypothetical protein
MGSNTAEATRGRDAAALGKRRYWRVRATCKVEYAVGSQRSSVFMENLSQGGMVLKAAPGLAIGNELDFTLHLDDEDAPLKIRGAVLRMGGGVAVRFLPRDKEAKRLRAYFTARIQQLEPAMQRSRPPLAKVVDLAALYRELERPEDAARCCRRGLEGNPRAIELYEILGLSLLDKAKTLSPAAALPALVEIDTAIKLGRELGESRILEVVGAEVLRLRGEVDRQHSASTRQEVEAALRREIEDAVRQQLTADHDKQLEAQRAELEARFEERLEQQRKELEARFTSQLEAEYADRKVLSERLEQGRLIYDRRIESLKVAEGELAELLAKAQAQRDERERAVEELHRELEARAQAMHQVEHELAELRAVMAKNAQSAETLAEQLALAKEEQAIAALARASAGETQRLLEDERQRWESARAATEIEWAERHKLLEREQERLAEEQGRLAQQNRELADRAVKLAGDAEAVGTSQALRGEIERLGNEVTRLRDEQRILTEEAETQLHELRASRDQAVLERDEAMRQAGRHEAEVRELRDRDGLRHGEAQRVAADLLRVDEATAAQEQREAAMQASMREVDEERQALVRERYEHHRFVEQARGELERERRLLMNRNAELETLRMELDDHSERAAADRAELTRREADLAERHVDLTNLEAATARGLHALERREAELLRERKQHQAPPPHPGKSADVLDDGFEILGPLIES